MSTKSCIRGFMMFFNVIFFLSGCGLLGGGIYLLMSDYGAHDISQILGNDLYHYAAYVAIAVGAAVMLISFCGCCGAWKEYKFFIGCYIVALVVILLALVAAAVLVYEFRTQMANDVKRQMEDVLVNKYGVNLNQSEENRVVTNMWDFIQHELKCCGVAGDMNSTSSWAIYKLKSRWYKQFATGKPYLPDSCCVSSGDYISCTGMSPFDGPPAQGPPLLGNMTPNPNIYHTGCYDELINFLDLHVYVIGVITIGVLAIVIFGIIVSACLCRKMRYTSLYD